MTITSTNPKAPGVGEDGLITEDAFRDIWGAHVRPNGDMFEHRDVVNLPLETVWTILEGDGGHWIASPGFHIVNKLGYCVSTMPWTDDSVDAYWFFDDLDSDEEDEEVDESDSED